MEGRQRANVGKRGKEQKTGSDEGKRGGEGTEIRKGETGERDGRESRWRKLLGAAPCSSRLIEALCGSRL